MKIVPNCYHHQHRPTTTTAGAAANATSNAATAKAATAEAISTLVTANVMRVTAQIYSHHLLQLLYFFAFKREKKTF
jgi:hypothetical protein